MRPIGIPKRAAIYCRLSYSPDGSLEKVERQEADCRRLADRLGWGISGAHVFRDNSRSAWQRNRKRPAWDALLEAVEAAAVDGILVYHGDRLMRQPWDLEKLLSVSDRKGLRIASPSGTRDLDSPDDRYILRIEVAQACRESDNTSRRVRRGLEVRAGRGLSQMGGFRPFGFGVQTGTRTKRDPDTGEEREVPVYDTGRQVPEEAELLAKAVEQMLAGLSQTGATKWLRTQSTTTSGGRWSEKTLRDILLSPRIAGLIEYNGTLRKAAWEPIISLEDWEDVKAIYRRNAERRPYPGRARKYLLSGVAECGTCAVTVRGRPVTPTGKRAHHSPYTQYYCPVCKRLSRKMAPVDAYVTGRVLQLLSDPRLLAELDQEPSGVNAGPAAEIAELERRKAATRQQLAELADHPGLDPQLAAESLASFDRRLGELRASLATTSRARLLRKMAGVTREQWEAEPVDVRAATVKLLYRVIIHPTAHRGPGFDPASVVVTRRPLLVAE